MLWRWVDVDAAADRAWDLLVDLDTWAQWGPTVTAARLDGGGRRLHQGATGSVRTPVGIWIPFVVNEFSAPSEASRWQASHGQASEVSAPGRSWSWRIAGVPATTHRVQQLGPGRCRVGMGVPGWAPAYLVVVELGLRRIRDLAEHG